MMLTAVRTAFAIGCLAAPVWAAFGEPLTAVAILAATAVAGVVALAVEARDDRPVTLPPAAVDRLTGVRATDRGTWQARRW